MKPATKSKPQPVRLAVEEWDFTLCSDEQLKYCCHYEYARASEQTKRYVSERRAAKSWDLGLYPGDAAYYQDQWFAAFFRPLTEFPTTPWLQIDAKKRQTVCDECSKWEGAMIEVDPERLPQDSEYPFVPQDTGLMSVRSVHVFEIEWTESPKAIQTAFEKWMENARPTPTRIVERRGMVSHRDKLKYLGALRLLESFDDRYRQAADFAFENGTKENGRLSKWVPQYSDQAGWIRARKAATSFIPHAKRSVTPSSLIGKIDRSTLSRIEKIRAKIHAAELDRAEQRRLKKLDAEARLERFKELAHKRSG